MKGFGDRGFKTEQCYSELCDCMRCFYVFERKAGENDLKAYLPKYFVKALNKNTINFLIFAHFCEGSRCKAKLQHFAVIL